MVALICSSKMTNEFEYIFMVLFVFLLLICRNAVYSNTNYIIIDHVYVCTCSRVLQKSLFPPTYHHSSMFKKLAQLYRFFYNFHDDSHIYSSSQQSLGARMSNLFPGANDGQRCTWDPGPLNPRPGTFPLNFATLIIFIKSPVCSSVYLFLNFYFQIYFLIWQLCN
ncbi:hypothetical protein HJG60_010928 [Phyllostomus discolor]|uniref:Uncharacterized protein n=1 Tax=Phyllostomus discolor TaxID=89673 RepID=A0A834ECU9_9CHIR|nr:hypothetical protein HJG60_010928 [Phyllostomus discolor]